LSVSFLCLAAGAKVMHGVTVRCAESRPEHFP
jgi:hypothetical protein